jgi:hypothetical protein
MTHNNTLTSVNEQDFMDNDPTLQYFTAIRHQEPEYESCECSSSRKLIKAVG